jgi:hypothetical protein
MKAEIKNQLPVGAPVFHKVGFQTIPGKVLKHSNKTIKIEQDNPDRADVAYVYPERLIHQHTYMAEEGSMLGEPIKATDFWSHIEKSETPVALQQSGGWAIFLDGSLRYLNRYKIILARKALSGEYDFYPFLHP